MIISKKKFNEAIENAVREEREQSYEKQHLENRFKEVWVEIDCLRKELYRVKRASGIEDKING